MTREAETFIVEACGRYVAGDCTPLDIPVEDVKEIARLAVRMGSVWASAARGYASPEHAETDYATIPAPLADLIEFNAERGTLATPTHPAPKDGGDDAS